MKKNIIVFYLIAFTLLQGIYQGFMFLMPEVAESANNNIMFSAFALLVIVSFSRGLLRDTTEGFLEMMNRGNMRYFMGILSVVVWFICAYRFYTDFHGTAVYEQNTAVVLVIAIIFTISIDILFKVIYTRLIWLYIQWKEMNKV